MIFSDREVVVGMGVVLGISIPLSILFIVFLIVLAICLIRRKNSKQQKPQPVQKIESGTQATPLTNVPTYAQIHHNYNEEASSDSSHQNSNTLNEMTSTHR